MKSLAPLVISFSLALAHYAFPSTIYSGTRSAEWKFIRMTANHYSSGPVESVTDPAIRCYEAALRNPSKALPVTAGSKLTFTSNNSMGHPGPVLFYMAKAPSGVDIATWDGSGAVWFKIQQKGSIGTEYPQFETNMQTIETTIPKATPNGNYLVRAEHIGLHIAGKPQHYLACAQVTVSGGGSGKPGPLVSFPGGYSASEPGLAVNIYSAKGPYRYPGPAVWTG